MIYNNTIIYYMSGTGNSYRVSNWIGKIVKNNGSATSVLSTKEGKPSEEIRNGNGNLIGIVFPTHGFTMPWHILKFVLQLPRRKSTHAFCIATRGSFKFGPVYIPGMSGTGTFITALILILKGYNVRGVMSVDMPSNWYSLHPIQRTKSHKSIINRTEPRVMDFVNIILSNGKVWFTLNNLYELIGGILLSWISVGYIFFGRFFLAKLFFANMNCDGCGICAMNCSFVGIKMRGKKNPKPFWKYSCESCMKCAAICPQNAIETGQSWGLILYFIITIPLSGYILSRINKFIPGISNIKGNWSGDIVNVLYIYLALFISYRLFHLLIQIPAINWIFTHTTMTHLTFWGRYREQNSKLKNINNRIKMH